MNPSVDDRLSSVVRALTDIILPVLPADASLAREQLQLTIGHVQILRAQLGDVAAFEREELEDARTLAVCLLSAGGGGAVVSAALGALQQAAMSASSADTVNQAIHEVIRAAGVDGAREFRASLRAKVIALEETRSSKDRRWFAPMGFDQEAAS